MAVANPRAPLVPKATLLRAMSSLMKILTLRGNYFMASRSSFSEAAFQ